MEIDKIYNLIANTTNEQKTFQENLEILNNLYNNIKKFIKENITDERLYTILEFLLKNENGQINENFSINILKNLINEENMFIFSLRQNIFAKNCGLKYINPNYRIEALINNLYNHINLSNNLKKLNLLSDNNLNKELNNYLSDNAKRDCLEALIMIISENFFDIKPSLGKKVIKYIEKEIVYLKEKEEKTNPLDGNLMERYIEILIPIFKYTKQNLNQSIIINKILNGEITDKRIVKKFITKIDSEVLINLINYDYQNFLNFYNKLSYLENIDKEKFFNKILKQLLNENYIYILLNYYIDCNNKSIKSMLDSQNILNIALNISPVKLNISIINYLLENNYTNANFIYNLKELVNSKKTPFSSNEKKIIKNNLEKYETKYIEELKFSNQDYNYKDALNLINNYLNENNSLSLDQAKQIIKTIIKYLNKEMGLEEIDIYFVDTKYNGEFLEDKIKRSISININLIKDFLNKDISLEKRIHIFITMLHELKHHKQYSTNTPVTIEEYKMRKERYLKDYDKNYYLKNYDIIYEEIDARADSYNMIQIFFETFFKEHLSKVQDHLITELNKELNNKKNQTTNKKVTVVNQKNVNFDFAFDILLKYNLDILKKEQIFHLEYNKDGTPKTLDELLANITSENEQIITEIIKNRYQYNFAKDSNKNIK